VNGPFPAGAWPDLGIFDSHLMVELEDGKKALANDGDPGQALSLTKSRRISRPVRNKSTAGSRIVDASRTCFHMVLTNTFPFSTLLLSSASSKVSLESVCNILLKLLEWINFGVQQSRS
jgi:hypothetical protein